MQLMRIFFKSHNKPGFISLVTFLEEGQKEERKGNGNIAWNIQMDFGGHSVSSESKNHRFTKPWPSNENSTSLEEVFATQQVK